MGLNPLRETLNAKTNRTELPETAFRPVVDAALASFRSTRLDIERRVRLGDLTVKAAREAMRAAAETLTRDLQEHASRFRQQRRPILDRLAEVAARREEARRHRSIEDLQRETNQLLRRNLLEQQIQNRVIEFEGQTYVRPLAGGAPATSLGSLLTFHEAARQAGDEAAMEWSRRQLEGMRSRVFSDHERELIDQATARPDRINQRILSAHLERLARANPDELEAFVTSALDSRDANACVAAFAMARQAPEESMPGWARRVLQNLDLFPDAALATLRDWEAQTRLAEERAIQAEVDYATTLAATEAALPSLRAPNEAQILLNSTIASRPLAQPGEPIGLTLTRRGLNPTELAALTQNAPETPPKENVETTDV